MNKSQQSIGCTVRSCAYNNGSNGCSLQSITVAPCRDTHSGLAEDESMCADYKSVQ